MISSGRRAARSVGCGGRRACRRRRRVITRISPLVSPPSAERWLVITPSVEREQVGPVVPLVITPIGPLIITPIDALILGRVGLLISAMGPRVITAMGRGQASHG
jgi:hypothetical protein